MTDQLVHRLGDLLFTVGIAILFLAIIAWILSIWKLGYAKRELQRKIPGIRFEGRRIIKPGPEPEPVLTDEQHRKRHEELHRALDELVADFIGAQRAEAAGRAPKLLDDTSVMELMHWSYQQTQHPTKWRLP